MTFWQWYVLTFAILFVIGPLALRTAMLWRLNGRNPLHFESPDTAYGFVQLCIGAVFVGYGVVIGLYLGAPATYSQLPGFAGLQHDKVRIAGLVLTLGGLLVTWIAQAQMGVSWRFGPDREAPPALVTSGIFAWVRNPIYLSMMLAATGMFCLLPDALSLVLWVLSLVLLNILVRLEEAFLRGVHGETYEQYLGRVGRFLPRLGG